LKELWQRLKKRRIESAVLAALLALGALSLLPGILKPGITPDETANVLIYDSLPRIVLGATVIYFMAVYGYSDVMKVRKGSIPFSLLWSLPCLLVAAANFPFSALITGSAVIDRTDMIWLTALKCAAIGLMEELLFRGLIHSVIKKRLENKKYRLFFAVFISSLVFSLWHLVNLFGGAGVGATFMQVGYSFLIGFMLAVTLEKTGNIWICVFIHAAFNFGGTLVTDLGSGEFQDRAFWIITVASAIICAVHVLITLAVLTKKDTRVNE